MKINQFEDIIAWQKSQDLAVNIYSIFRNSKDFGFRDQICRAAVSISNNIAEGFERSSDAEFSKFLFISAGSCGEVRSMVYLAERLGYISLEQKNQLLQSAIEVSKLIKGFIKALKKTK
ncbi:MAG: four helix bundle protein [Bacteroidales bacterium]|nr:four helix bundle protein [Bacteroidales bacterium]